MEEKRRARKYQHLEYASQLPPGPLSSGWEDLHLVHQALLCGNWAELDTSTVIFDKKISLPLLINAITGGAPGLDEINGALARVAARCGLGLAVGSQTGAVIDRSVRHTFDIVRKHNPSGLILANVSALADPKGALEAVEMIQADALQLHLNGIQELLMEEGDRNFAVLSDNIAYLTEVSPVPVIIKEVGSGISRDTAKALYGIGVRAFDLGGAGGTNFAAIELARTNERGRDHFRFWGLSTAVSLLEVVSLGLPITILASGGLENALDICKALSLGASAVAMAGRFLKVLQKEGEEQLIERIGKLGEDLRILMMLTGAAKISDLKKQPLVITGYCKEWCDQRGIDTTVYARRQI